ncbi:hypothetical protein MMPV_006667 [Pyropia vietnamensis]
MEGTPPTAAAALDGAVGGSDGSPYTARPAGGSALALAFSSRPTPPWRTTLRRARRIVGSISVTNALLAANVLVYAANVASRGALLAAGAKLNAPILAGTELHRLATSMFLHDGLLHLGANCLSLSSLGPSAEAVFGRTRMAAGYVAAGVAAAAASVAWTPYPAVGASGAVFGLLGGLMVYLLLNRQGVTRGRGRSFRALVGVAAVNLAYGAMPGGRVDNAGHVGGLAAGAVLAAIAGPRYRVVRGRLVDVPLGVAAVRWRPGGMRSGGGDW